MNKQTSQLVRRMTTLLGAIAASSLLGLPALAGTPMGDANTDRKQAQPPSTSDQSQCPPIPQANRPSTTATPDASAPAAAQLPNQSDPRAGLAPSDQTLRRATANTTASTSTMQAIAPANTIRQPALDGNVLAQGGVTSGGFAIQQVSAASNPEASRTVSSRYSSNQERPNYVGTRTDQTGNIDTTTSENASMRSSRASQPYSQASPTTGSMTLAQCPGGMTTPQSTTPSTREVPGQSNLNSQPSLPQPTGNETRQTPADDNSGRTR